MPKDADDIQTCLPDARFDLEVSPTFQSQQFADHFRCQITAQVDDPKDLKTMRLVSPAWSIAAARTLFMSLEVSIDPKELQRLSDLVCRRDSVVRQVVSGLKFWPSLQTTRSVERKGASKGLRLKLEEQMRNTLTRSLRRTPNVQSLEIHLNNVKRLDDKKCVDPDECLRQPSQSGIELLFEVLAERPLPNLTRMRLILGDDPWWKPPMRFQSPDEISVRHVCEQIRELHVDVVKPRTRWQGKARAWSLGPPHEVSGIVRTSLESARQLQHLSLHGYNHWAPMMVHFHRFEELSCLDMTFVSVNVHDLAKALQLGAQYLKSFRVVHSKVESETGRLVDMFKVLAKAPLLTFLDIRDLCYIQEAQQHRDYRYENPSPYWEDDYNQSDLWDMIESSHLEDLHACRDLLVTVNDNRIRAKMRPCFTASPDVTELETQSQWLMQLVSLEEFQVFGKTHTWTKAGWEDAKRLLIREYPYVNAQKREDWLWE